jgi:hypothetical protein
MSRFQRVSRTLRILLLPAIAAGVCASCHHYAVLNSQQIAPQSPQSTASEPDGYFPPGAFVQAGTFSSFLTYSREPSLLAAAQDPGTAAYRFDLLTFMPAWFRTVRLSFNPDGSARIIVTEQGYDPKDVRHVTELPVSSSDAKKFLDLVDKANFWSMPGVTPHPGYYRDASMWVLEGVRNGNYHVVYREEPDARDLAEMVFFLVRNLSKRDLPGISY